MRIFATFFIFTLFVGLVFPQQSDLDKLVETERAFAKMARDKSTKEAFLFFLADAGIVFEPVASNGKMIWQKKPDSVGLLSWQPVWADIDSSGTLGYTTGPWEFRPQGADGEPVAFGQYLTIWKKQRNGDFKAVLDVGVSHDKHASPASEIAYPNDAGRASEGVEDAKTPVDFGGLRPKQAVAEDARLFRDKSFPFVGKAAASERAVSDGMNLRRTQWEGINCDGSKELYYCFTRFNVTYQDDRKYCGNHVRIWKFRSGEWQLAVDLIAELSDCK